MRQASTSSAKEVVALFDAFKRSFDAGEAALDTAQQQLVKLKIAMLNFQSLPPAAPTAPPACASGHYMIQPLVELYAGCMVVLKVS